MYLHKDDRELFRDIIVTVSEKSGFEENIVVKDYYVKLETALMSCSCPTDVGRILRTFKIKKNVEVTDNGKIII